MHFRDTLKINGKGHLEIGGADTTDLAAEFGTPLYVMDEAYIRAMCRVYQNTIDTKYNGNGLVLYASKAFACKAVYKIVEQEGIGVDAVSGGEVYTAMEAGFPASRIYLHGNNKLYSELKLAVENGVGNIIVDSYRELDVLDAICAENGKIQSILLRINPGVEAHTHKFIQTARTDSKFGFSISDGTADKITAAALSKKNLKLKGYHCHIGSQIFEKQSFCLAAEKMIAFIAKVKAEFGYEAEELNLGGGYGIWYTDEDAQYSIPEYASYLSTVIDAVKKASRTYAVKEPFLLIEPGRSIVGEAGITLYTVGAIKEIPGIKKYVAIDGGMFDNPRYALYESKYTPVLANRATEENAEIVTIAGKCCESGDLIAVDVPLPAVREGDILAILSTGAYNYSMASNYNRNPIPGVVLVKDGKARIIVKPQDYKDLVRNDVIPEDLL